MVRALRAEGYDGSSTALAEKYPLCPEIEKYPLCPEMKLVLSQDG